MKFSPDVQHLYPCNVTVYIWEVKNRQKVRPCFKIMYMKCGSSTDIGLPEVILARNMTFNEIQDDSLALGLGAI